MSFRYGTKSIHPGINRQHLLRGVCLQLSGQDGSREMIMMISNGEVTGREMRYLPLSHFPTLSRLLETVRDKAK